MDNFILIAVDSFYFILGLSTLICAIGVMKSQYTYPVLLTIYFALASFNALHLASILLVARLTGYTGGLFGEPWFYTLTIGLWATAALILANQYVLDYIDDRVRRGVLQELKEGYDS